MPRLFALLPALLLLGGCAINPFSHHYVDLSEHLPAETVSRMLPADPEPTVLGIAIDEFESVHRRLQENGLVQLGQAYFLGGNPSRSGLIAHARRVEADVVVWASEYSHTSSGTMTAYVYQPGQTTRSSYQGFGNASAFGSGGFASGRSSYSGSATTRTDGTLVPQQRSYSVAIYKHGATFWRRTRPGILGASVSDIPSDDRTRLGRNTGAYVDLVVNGGPAFLADVLAGDVIIGVEDREVRSPAELTEALTELAGRTVRLAVLRNGRPVPLTVTLNAPPTPEPADAPGTPDTPTN